EEKMKWNHVSFEHKGMLGGMATFKHHVTFGFWKARLLEDFYHLFTGAPRSSMMGVRVTTGKELPPKKVMVACVREAKRLNDEGIKEPKRARPKGPVKVTVPADLKA